MCGKDRDWVVSGVAELSEWERWESIIPSDGGNAKVAIYNPSHTLRVDGGGGNWKNHSVHHHPDMLMCFIVLYCTSPHLLFLFQFGLSSFY